MFVAAVAPVVATYSGYLLTKSSFFFVATPVVAFAVTVALAVSPELRNAIRRLLGFVWRKLRAGLRVAGNGIRKHPWITVVIVVVVLALVGWHLWGLLVPPPACASSRQDVGDSATARSAPSLEDLRRVIGEENERVEASGQSYVTIAFMASLADEVLSAGRLVHQVGGAYTAQLRANQGRLIGSSPQIRLELVDMGQDERNWRDAVAKVEKLAKGPEHLVAVTGMGVSHRNTLNAARELSKAEIPMVGDVLTADGFNITGGIDPKGGRIPGLFRMPFPVSTQLALIDCHLQEKRRDLDTALLVEDADNDGGKPDLYAKSLAIAFRKGRFDESLKQAGNVTNRFGGANSDKKALDNEFQGIAGNLCGVDPPEMVFYAGRARYLPNFLDYLRNRNCANADHALTVITGSDASNLAHQGDLGRRLAAAHVSVLYVPLAHPADLDDPGNPKRGRFKEFADEFTTTHSRVRFDRGSLLDGWAVMAHDAFLTAAKAAHKAYDPQSSPSSASVRNQIGLFTASTNTVPGATGDFLIDSQTGDRKGGAAPVVHSFGAS
ncbi:MAG: hypothetical protein HOW71_35840 [Nonomuraea sp.]|nr:hypothetical protein [Nonomuraea sp.]